MSSPHPHHHCQSHIPLNTTAISTACCCCFYNQCCQPHHPTPAPPPPSPQQLPIDDPLLQALASLLQHHRPQQQQQHPNLYSTHPKPQAHKNLHQNPQFQTQKLHFEPQDHHHQQTQFVLSSLLQRINTLESSLHHISISNHSYSLKETAARIIQAHFRAFLVRRSRTLRQLKELAFIKSSFNSLKSSIYSEKHFDFEVVSHRAMDLLLKLDSVQGGDPMIRDGKKSVSRDLVKFLEFIDGYACKRTVLSYKSANNVSFVGRNNKLRSLNANNRYGDLSTHQKEIVENLKNRIERIRAVSKGLENDEEDVELEGFQQFIVDPEGEESPRVSKANGGILFKRHGGQPKLKKTVRFAENGNLFRVFSDAVVEGNSSYADESVSSDGHTEIMEDNCNEVEERQGISECTKNDEEANLENGQSAHTSDGERNARRNPRSSTDFGSNGHLLNQEGSLLFSAPVPVKMESRAELISQKAVKIVK